MTPEQRRRLAEVFGDEAWAHQSSDDMADPRENVDSDERLRREVPPHHG